MIQAVIPLLFFRTTKIHLVAANARCALTFALSPGQAGDAPHGRELLKAWAAPVRHCHLIMDRAYEGDETRQLALDLGFIPVVPPNPNRIAPWQYDRAMYRRRNEVDLTAHFLSGSSSLTPAEQHVAPR